MDSVEMSVEFLRFPSSMWRSRPSGVFRSVAAAALMAEVGSNPCHLEFSGASQLLNIGKHSRSRVLMFW